MLAGGGGVTFYMFKSVPTNTVSFDLFQEFIFPYILGADIKHV